MKILILMSFLFSHALFAQSGPSLWKLSNSEQKEFIINEYRIFYSELKEENLESFDERNVSILNFLINEAWADGAYNCIYAGWPSKRIGGSCSSPKKNNSDYEQGPCGAGQMQCQPLLFGKGHCTSIATKKMRNLAFSNCAKKADSPATIVQQIEADGSIQKLNELMSYADNICSSGKQANTGMCSRLRKSLNSLRPLAEKVVAPAETPAVETDKPAEPVITPPKQDGPAEEQAQIVQAAKDAINIPAVVASANQIVCPEGTTAMNRVVIQKDEKVPVLVCNPEKSIVPPEDEASLLSLIKPKFHPSEEAVKASPEYKSFIQEMAKFPKQFLQELSDAGAFSSLVIGKGVTEDPSWDSNLVETFDGRDWKYVAGSGGINIKKKNNLPTRIVINRMYQALDDDGVTVKNSGTVNLALHEHAHSLDNLYGKHSISGSTAWLAVLNDSKTADYIKKILSEYEYKHEGEGFSELFAYYHGCEASRIQMETEAPALANFFKNFKSVKELRPDLYDKWD